MNGVQKILYPELQNAMLNIERLESMLKEQKKKRDELIQALANQLKSADQSADKVGS